MIDNKTDVVLTWVDDSDEKWIAERNYYLIGSSEENKSSVNVRYRDWDTLKYVFRGIEKNMPWINKVHFVTCGHLPEWLNVSHPQLHIVKHEDFISKDYLPTFNSSAIEVNLFRIPGLSEQYINFNDDMFVIKKTSETDFFKDGLPCDMACISPQPIKRESIYNVELNNLKIINSYFSVSDVKRNWKKWLNPFKYGRYALRTLIFMQFKTIIGVFEQHIPFSYLKSVAADVWEKESKELNNTSSHKFRSLEDENEWLFRMWQLFEGRFSPRSSRFGKLVSASDSVGIHKAVMDRKCKVICINDDATVENFDKAKENVINELNTVLSEKSQFEI